MKLSKRITVISISILCLIVSLYAFTWIETVQRSHRFYKDALDFYNRGDLVKSIKGSEEIVSGEYVFLGGLQQVCSMWESPLAWPKPGIYHDANQLLDRIIKREMTTDTGMMIFKQYFQLDRKYLDRILLQVGDLFLEEGEYARAEEVFRNAMEIFVQSEDVQSYSAEKLSRIQELQ